MRHTPPNFQQLPDPAVPQSDCSTFFFICPIWVFGLSLSPSPALSHDPPTRVLVRGSSLSSAKLTKVLSTVHWHSFIGEFANTLKKFVSLSRSLCDILELGMYLH